MQISRETCTAPRQMKYRTLKAVRIELERQGGWLETIRDTEQLEHAPHLPSDPDPAGWPHGLLNTAEVINWANQTNFGAIKHPDWY